MNRDWWVFLTDFKSVPHRRGDEPGDMVDVMNFAACSPQAWG